MTGKKVPKIRGVYERNPGTGIWWIRFTEGGKIRREKVGRRSDAIALYQKRKADVRTGIKLPANLRKRSITILELGQEAKQWYREHGRRDLRTFSGRMDLIIRELGSLSADTVKPKDLDEWLSSHPRWSPATKNRYKTVLSKAYQLALNSDRVNRNPVRSVERRNEGDGRIRYLKQEEEVSLKAAIARRCPGHMPAFIFALHTGLRKSEQFGLTWSDIDMDRRVIIVPHPKNNRSREITMNETCFAIIKSLYCDRPDRENIFRSDRYKKRPIIDIKKAFEGAMKEAKIEGFTWHCLRHTFITRLVQAGVEASLNRSHWQGQNDSPSLSNFLGLPLGRLFLPVMSLRLGRSAGWSLSETPFRIETADSELTTNLRRLALKVMLSGGFDPRLERISPDRYGV